MLSICRNNIFQSLSPNLYGLFFWADNVFSHFFSCIILFVKGEISIFLDLKIFHCLTILNNPTYFFRPYTYFFRPFTISKSLTSHIKYGNFGISYSRCKQYYKQYCKQKVRTFFLQKKSRRYSNPEIRIEQIFQLHLLKPKTVIVHILNDQRAGI